MSINPITFDLPFHWLTLIHFQGKSSFTLISLLFHSLACLPPLVFRSLPHAVLSKMVGIDSLASRAAFCSFVFFGLVSQLLERTVHSDHAVPLQ